MKPEEQRVAIAQWCGWKHVGWSSDFTQPVMENPTGSRTWYWQELPDYLNDLNAMHEAESRLSPEEWGKYVSSLASNDDDQTFALVHATATQKSKSLLVAIGKWTDSTLHTKG